MKKYKELKKRTQSAILTIIVILFFSVILKSSLSNTFELMTNAPFKFILSFKDDNVYIDPTKLTFIYVEIGSNHPVNGIITSQYSKNDNFLITFNGRIDQTKRYYMIIRGEDVETLNLIDSNQLTVKGHPSITMKSKGIKVEMKNDESTIQLIEKPGEDTSHLISHNFDISFKDDNVYIDPTKLTFIYVEIGSNHPVKGIITSQYSKNENFLITFNGRIDKTKRYYMIIRGVDRKTLDLIGSNQLTVEGHPSIRMNSEGIKVEMRNDESTIQLIENPSEDTSHPILHNFDISFS